MNLSDFATLFWFTSEREKMGNI